MSGIEVTLSELVFDSAPAQRSRWRVNAGLNDFHPVGMLQWMGIDISPTACRVIHPDRAEILDEQIAKKVV